MLCSLEALWPADNPNGVLYFESLTTHGVDTDEAKTIKSLLFSYMADLNHLTVSQASPAVTHLKPDFVMHGELSADGTSRKLTLTLYTLATGRAVTESALYQHTSDLALNLRSLIERCFAPPQRKRDNNLPLTSPRDVMGTWQGEDGIALACIAAHYRAYIYYRSGGVMELSYSIKDNVLTLKQKSPNNYRYYYPLPERAAKRLARNARPTEWRLSLYGDGRVLAGVRAASTPTAHSIITNVEWVKMSY
jgi:hypothetical protein